MKIKKPTSSYTEVVVATRKFVYDLETARKELEEVGGEPPTDAYLWEVLLEWAQEDLRSPMEDSEIVWLDGDGNRVYPVDEE